METIELDLHGRTWSEAFEEFIRVYNDAVDSAPESAALHIVVIHGYGSSGEGGVIRHRLRSYLRRFPNRVDFTPGEETTGNRGCTEITPLTKLPNSYDLLEEEISTFCMAPRTKGAIARKLRRYGDRRVLNAMQNLTRQGRLTKTRNKTALVYVSR